VVQHAQAKAQLHLEQPMQPLEAVSELEWQFLFMAAMAKVQTWSVRNPLLACGRALSLERGFHP
jgi:hypothetical protein